MTIARRLALLALLLCFGLLFAAPAGAEPVHFSLDEQDRQSLAVGAHVPLAPLPRLSGPVALETSGSYQLAAIPTDPFYEQQWYLSNLGQSVFDVTGLPGADIGAEAGWDIANGSGQLIAYVDTGIQLDHPDLASNIWANPAEVRNGIDDDGNGLIDDVNGWNFIGNNSDITDVDGHGTLIGGEMAAIANNNEGIAGLAYGARIMPLRASVTESVNIPKAAKAFRYAAEHGAEVVNASFGGKARSRAVELVLAENPQTLFVVAAGNLRQNVERKPTYPCSLPNLNVICVTATDAADNLAGFSNYGRRSVDLAAPGVSMASTYPGSRYAYADGSSMSAPLVTATVALIKQRFPRYDAYQVRQKLLGSVDRLPALRGLVATAGRLNVAAALRPGDKSLPKTRFPKQKRVFGAKRFAYIRYRANRPGVLIECRIGGGPWIGCAEGKNGKLRIDTHYLRNRRYVLMARAIDRDGEAERWPRRFRFKVEKRWWKH